MALQGNLHDMTVADLIQHSCQDGKTARIMIEHNGRHAGLFSRPASWSMLSWPVNMARRWSTLY